MADNPAAAFEEAVLGRLLPLAGRRLGDLAQELGMGTTAGKAAVATIVRKVVARTAGSLRRLRSLRRRGEDGSGQPSGEGGRTDIVPGFVHEELIYETWSESDLLGRLNRILFVPVQRETGATLNETVLGRVFFWTPTPQELDGIAKEWEVCSRPDSGRAGYALA